MTSLKQAIYKSVDLLTGGRGVKRQVGNAEIRFPARWSRYYESDYEPKTFKFVRESVHPGDTVLDIGAHIGLFGIVLAQIVGEKGKVFCFEPTPFTGEVLKQIVKINDCSQIVEVRGEAVSDKKGTTTFYDTGDSEVSNANSLVKGNRSHHGIEVQLTTVDDFVAEKNLKVDFMKIDVEGAELDLLRGASKTFLEHRPIAHLSLHPFAIIANEQNLGEIWDLLKSYRMRVFFDDQEIEKDFFCRHDDLFDVNLLPEQR